MNDAVDDAVGPVPDATAAELAATDSAAPRTLKAPVLVLLVAGAAVALFAATQIWVRARLAIEGFPGVGVTPTGRTLVPLVPAVGLLALGGALALLLVGRWGRVIIGALVAVLSVVAALAALRVSTDPAAAVSGTLAEAAGVTQLPEGSTAVVATSSVWPVIAAIGLAVVIVGAFAAAVAPAPRWPRGGKRYSAPADRGSSASSGGAPRADDGSGDASPAGSGDPSRPGGVGLWDALDRGDDPTV